MSDAVIGGVQVESDRRRWGESAENSSSDICSSAHDAAACSNDLFTSNQQQMDGKRQEEEDRWNSSCFCEEILFLAWYGKLWIQVRTRWVSVTQTSSVQLERASSLQSDCHAGRFLDPSLTWSWETDVPTKTSRWNVSGSFKGTKAVFEFVSFEFRNPPAARGFYFEGPVEWRNSKEELPPPARMLNIKPPDECVCVRSIYRSLNDASQESHKHTSISRCTSTFLPSCCCSRAAPDPSSG